MASPFAEETNSAKGEQRSVTIIAASAAGNHAAADFSFTRSMSAPTAASFCSIFS